MDGSVWKITDAEADVCNNIERVVSRPGKEELWQIQIVTAVQIMCTTKTMNVIVVW